MNQTALSGNHLVHSTWAGPTLTPIGPRAQFYRPWCTLTGELGPTEIVPNWASRPILQSLVQVDQEPGLTEIAPNWALRPILQSLVHVDWGTWTDRRYSKLGLKANSTVLGASWPGTWTYRNCSKLGPKANSTVLGASWPGTWTDRNCSKLGPTPPKAGPARRYKVLNIQQVETLAASRLQLKTYNSSYSPSSMCCFTDSVSLRHGCNCRNM